jgi:hypothetical protein
MITAVAWGRNGVRLGGEEILKSGGVSNLIFETWRSTERGTVLLCISYIPKENNEGIKSFSLEL